MKKVIRILAHFVKLFIAYVIAFFMKLFCKKYRNVWIVSERGDDARDNGWFFFRYLKENHPEINAHYIIAKSSADYKKVAEISDPIEYESLKHYIYYALCKVRISSHAWGGDLPKADYFKKTERFMSKRKKVVFLQHGVIKDFMPGLTANNTRLDIFICGAKPEYDYINESFGHPKGVVQYTGLARYDNLHDIKTKNQILLMPTFRKWLQKMTEDEVAKSEYVKEWNSAINDKNLIRLLKENHLELIFYPHYEIQKHIDLFISDDPCVKIAKFKDYDVQTLLIESKLLVTDFSSVFFDFAYMEKPVIYYHFDREQYIKGHYDFTKGYFSYDNNGFGKVVFDKNELINEIKDQINRGFEVTDEYKERTNVFFPIKDKKNCERIFDEINKL